MLVKMPEPAGDAVELFRLGIDCPAMSKKDLEGLCFMVEASLDEVCSVLKRGEFSIADYNLTLRNAISKKIVGNILQGGFVISEKSMWVVDDLQERYKSSFAEIIRSYDNFPIIANMEIAAFRDSVTSEVMARNPYSD